jgi:hypothetical protein
LGTGTMALCWDPVLDVSIHEVDDVATLFAITAKADVPWWCGDGTTTEGRIDLQPYIEDAGPHLYIIVIF